MNLRDLKYVIAVAETGHFGKAAKHCFVSQPTLSGQIKKLEEELGVTLFERTNRSVETTQVGMEVVDRARQMMAEADAIKQIAESHKDPLAGPLRIGAIPTLSPYIMPLLLRAIRSTHSQMRLVISEEQTERLLERLHNHQIDVALLATEEDTNEFDSIPLFHEPFWVAYHRKHAFYEREAITAKDLKNDEVLLLAKGHCLADQAREICQLKDHMATGQMADLRASSLETLIQLVGAGYGITLVPALAMSGSWTTDSGVVAQPLEGHSGRTVRLVYRNSFPRMAALDVLRSVLIKTLPNTVKSII